METLTLHPASKMFTRSNGFLEAEIDGEVIGLNIEKGTCYGLNQVGSRVWKLLEKPSSLPEICARLVEEYDVDPASCERDVADLLEEMLAEGMLSTP